MRASVLLTGALAAGCFNPTGSVFASESTSTTEVSSDPGASSGTDTGPGSEASSSTVAEGSTSATSDEVSSSSASSSVDSCGDGQLQEGEECDGEEGCTAECTKAFRRVFVTSEVFTGDLGGIAGADQKCQTAAENAGLPGEYMAWISSSEGAPAERFVQSVVPYRQLDGVQIAASWSELIDGDLESGIYLTELKNFPQKGTAKSCMLDIAFAWSNTQESGVLWQTNYACGDWLEEAGSGYTGRVGLIDGGWTVDCIADCLDEAALYCVEQ